MMERQWNSMHILWGRLANTKSRRYLGHSYYYSGYTTSSWAIWWAICSDGCNICSKTIIFQWYKFFFSVAIARVLRLCFFLFQLLVISCYQSILLNNSQKYKMTVDISSQILYDKTGDCGKIPWTIVLFATPGFLLMAWLQLKYGHD